MPTTQPANAKSPTLKSMLITGAISFALAYFGWQLSDKASSSPSASTLAKYDKLCKTGIKTTGILDDSYSQSTFKIVKGSSGTKLNSFSYTYKVNGATYTGRFSMQSVPDKPEVEIWYDATNPAEHHMGDPCKQYKFSKEKQYPSWYAWIGYPMLIIGGLVFFSVIRMLIRHLFMKAVRR